MLLLLQLRVRGEEEVVPWGAGAPTWRVAGIGWEAVVGKRDVLRTESPRSVGPHFCSFEGSGVRFEMFFPCKLLSAWLFWTREESGEKVMRNNLAKRRDNVTLS
jgi:hypothetical protein